MHHRYAVICAGHPAGSAKPDAIRATVEGLRASHPDLAIEPFLAGTPFAAQVAPERAAADLLLAALRAAGFPSWIQLLREGQAVPAGLLAAPVAAAPSALEPGPPAVAAIVSIVKAARSRRGLALTAAGAAVTLAIALLWWAPGARKEQPAGESVAAAGNAILASERAEPAAATVAPPAVENGVPPPALESYDPPAFTEPVPIPATPAPAPGPSVAPAKRLVVPAESAPPAPPPQRAPVAAAAPAPLTQTPRPAPSSPRQQTPAQASGPSPAAKPKQAAVSPPAPQAPPAPIIVPPSVAPTQARKLNYPRDAFLDGVEGTVVIRVLVSVDGEVLQAAVERRSGHASLDAEGLAAVRRWRFNPGSRNGVPEKASVLVSLKFKLDQ